MRNWISKRLLLVIGLVVLCVFQSPSALAATPLGTSHVNGWLKGSASYSSSAPGIDISDEHAKQLVIKDGRPDVAAHMLHRVLSPLSSQYQYNQHFSIVSDNNAVWAGYTADILHTPYYSDGASANFPARSICFKFGCNPLLGEWVGVGGYDGPNLIQTGVDISHSTAWYEMLPASAVNVFLVHSGDLMYADVSLDTSNGLWYINITDETTGTYYAHDFSYNPDRNSSEWIFEVGYNTGAVPNFNSIPFTNAHWFDNLSRFQTVTSEANPTYKEILSQDPQGGCASPGPLGSDQESFTVSPSC